MRVGEGTWQQMVLLAVHDPALVQGLGTGLGLGPGLGPGSGLGSEQGQEPGLDQPQPPPQSQSAHRIVISTTAARSMDIPPSRRPSPRPLAGALGTEAMAGDGWMFHPSGGHCTTLSAGVFERCRGGT